MEEERRVAQGEARGVGEACREGAAAVLCRGAMDAAVVDGLGRREPYVGDTRREGGHEEGVLAVGDVCAVAGVGNDGAWNEFAARRGEKAAAAEEGDVGESGAAAVGPRQVVVGIGAVGLVVVLDVGFDNGVVVGLSREVGEVGGREPVVVVDKREVTTARDVDGEVAGTGYSGLGAVDAAYVGLGSVAADVVVDALLVILLRSVEDDDHLEVVGRERLCEERVEGLPEVVFGTVCGNDDGDEHRLLKEMAIVGLEVAGADDAVGLGDSGVTVMRQSEPSAQSCVSRSMKEGMSLKSGS